MPHSSILAPLVSTNANERVWNVAHATCPSSTLRCTCEYRASLCPVSGCCNVVVVVVHRVIHSTGWPYNSDYRLAALPLELPPLSERRVDIVPLAEHYLGLNGNRDECLLPAFERGGIARSRRPLLPVYSRWGRSGDSCWTCTWQVVRHTLSGRGMCGSYST